MYTDWEQQFHKEKWQIVAYERIKSKLYSSQNNKFPRFDNIQENHLVMVYGQSQVGKTTLILNMIGVRIGCYKEVDDTLRAGIKHGNSSTSTAIIYSRSDNDEYGLAVSSFDDLGNKSVSYYNKSEMMEELQAVRNNVEKNKQSTNTILYIYIPKSFFDNRSFNNRIHILDLPGISSRNHKEKNHVQNLMDRYLRFSAACLIVCQSMNIQSLETLELPTNDDWRNWNSKFAIVVTKAYSDASSKNYFRKEMKSSFYEYISNTYTEEVQKILGKNNKTKVFALDMGDSLNRLINDELQNDADKNEVLEVKDRVLNDLQKYIISNEGHRLKAALSELSDIAKHYEERKKVKLEADIYKCKQHKVRNEISIKKQEELCNRINEKSKTLEENINGKTNNISRLDEYKCVLDNFAEAVFKWIGEKSLYKKRSKGKISFKDHEKVLWKDIKIYIERKASEICDSCQDLLDKELISWAQISFESDKTELNIDFLNAISVQENSLYPVKRFLKKNTVSFEYCSLIINSMQVSLKEVVIRYIDNIKEKAGKYIKEKEKTLRQCKYWYLKTVVFMGVLKREIDKTNEMIDEKKDELERILDKRKHDEAELESYKDEAYNSYIEQRNDIVNALNKNKAIDDKMSLMLLLGILDRDYEAVIGGI